MCTVYQEESKDPKDVQGGTCFRQADAQEDLKAGNSGYVSTGFRFRQCDVCTGDGQSLRNGGNGGLCGGRKGGIAGDDADV